MCDVLGCGGNIHAKGFCERHYRRFKRHGDPLGGSDHIRSPGKAFDARTVRSGECLIWTGGMTGGGYGVMHIGGKTIGAHVYAWERENGSVPSGYRIDHAFSCSPACVEVAHLRLATASQNGSNRRGAQSNSRTGARNVRPSGRGFEVCIGLMGEYKTWGGFKSIEDASEFAEARRREMFGRFSGQG